MKCSGKCRGRRSRRERRGERERPAFMETMLPIVFFRMILENRHKRETERERERERDRERGRERGGGGGGGGGRRLRGRIVWVLLLCIIVRQRGTIQKFPRIKQVIDKVFNLLFITCH